VVSGYLWPSGFFEETVPKIAINIDAVGIDLHRLERSLGLRANRIGPGRFRVEGGVQPHWVDLYTRGLPRCDCADHLWREQICNTFSPPSCVKVTNGWSSPCMAW
jgi:hypothetical protein